MDNVTQFPSRHESRKRFRRNKNQVPCQVSARWLQFPKDAWAFPNGTFISIDLMTIGSDENPRKLCELVLLKEDLVEMLNKLEVKGASSET